MPRLEHESDTSLNKKRVTDDVCSRRSGVITDNSWVCRGRCFAVRASEVDQDVWNKVMEIIKDGSKFNRLIKTTTTKLAERHEEALQGQELVEAELADMRATQARVYERMTRESDDTIYAMHRTELQRLNETIASLEKRASEAQSAVDLTQQHQDAHSKVLERIDAAIAQHGREGSALPGFRDWFEQVDDLTSEEKRSILKALDVKVKMYPRSSLFAKTHDQRWELTFTAY